MSEMAIKSIGADQMLDSINIERFRGIKELSLTDAGRVNLIVGRNDAGKTTLIEAIRLLLSGDPRYLRRGSRSRLARTPVNPEQSYRLAFYHSQSDVPLIIRGAIGDLRISAQAEISQVQEQQFTLPIDFMEEEDQNSETVASFLQPYYEVVLIVQTSNGAGTTIRLPLGIGTVLPPRSRREGFGNAFPKLPDLVWLGTNRAEMWAHAHRYSHLYRTGGEALLLEVLKEIEPRLKSLVVLTSQDDESSSTPVLEVDLGLEQLLPLDSMGDGFSSVIAIISAIGAAESGICLIDEVENGIHYSLLTQMWRSAALAAEKYHSQLWATTHSYDCINAIYEAFFDSPDALRVHRLDRKPDGAVAVHTFTHVMLGRALERGLEVR